MATGGELALVDASDYLQEVSKIGLTHLLCLACF
jgi:hypothetical protein